MHANNCPSPKQTLIPVGTRVRVREAVRTQYFVSSTQARRAGWYGTVCDTTSEAFPDYVYVNFDLRARQRRPHLRELVAIRDLEAERNLDVRVARSACPAVLKD